MGKMELTVPIGRSGRDVIKYLRPENCFGNPGKFMYPVSVERVYLHDEPTTCDDDGLLNDDVVILLTLREMSHEDTIKYLGRAKRRLTVDRKRTMKSRGMMVNSSTSTEKTFIRDPFEYIFDLENTNGLTFPGITYCGESKTTAEFNEIYNLLDVVCRATVESENIGRLMYYIPYYSIHPIYVNYTHGMQGEPVVTPKPKTQLEKLERTTEQLETENKKSTLDKIKSSQLYPVFMSTLKDVITKAYLNPPTKRETIKTVWRVLKLTTGVIYQVSRVGTSVVAWISIISDIIYILPMAIRSIVYEHTRGLVRTPFRVVAFPMIKAMKLLKKTISVTRKTADRIVGEEMVNKTLDDIGKIQLFFELLDSGEIWEIIPRVILDIPDDVKGLSKKQRLKRERVRKSMEETLKKIRL